MAEVRFSQENFSCPVCLDPVKDPVTTSCGHSYCMRCITDHWNQEDQKRFYSCPQCRQTFGSRPTLCKNTMLADVVEQLKKTNLQTADSAGPGDGECDVCTGRKQKSIKSCLTCASSFCQNHLEQHENLFKGKKHNVIDATGRLQKICHQHNEPLDIYCHADQHCICTVCNVDKHKKHKTVSSASERKEKQKDLGERQTKFQKQIQKREKLFQKLKEVVETHKHSAQTAVEVSERIFTELISSIERRRREVIQMIRDRERIVVSRAEELLKQLVQEINLLNGTDAELQQLSQTHDHTHFLQSFPYLPVPPGSPVVPSITVSSYDDVVKSVSQMRQKLEDFCREKIEKLSGRVRCIQIIPTPEYESRKDFLQYFYQFALDPDTANPRLCLSEKNRQVTSTTTPKSYSRHPYRFDGCLQVLCTECVCERCYWEVEWSGSRDVFVYISVSYQSISRKGEGNECKFGYNDQSWCLICSPSSYSFCHNDKKTELPVVSSSRRIGVYVDYNIGILSFYSVSDTMNLIHRVQTTFTQPLYPGFRIKYTFKDGIMDKLFRQEHPAVKLCEIQV